MQVHVSTGRNIEGSEGLSAHITGVVQDALGRFVTRVKRVDVHLSDQNGEKSGLEDKRCAMEARIEGQRATTVTHQAATVNEAVIGAVDKLERRLASALEKLRDNR